jgi:hypothetical protein
MGPLARDLETFFTGHGLALPTDHAEQLAAGSWQLAVDSAALTPFPDCRARPWKNSPA